jgi:carbon-monoxide dehydrogenase large subunit
MTAAAHPGIATRVLGAGVKRLEDPRLLVGRGRYFDDIRLPGLLHAAFVRSSHAHARVSGVNPSAGLGAPGVVVVLSG